MNRSLRPSGWQIPTSHLIAFDAAKWVAIAEDFRIFELHLTDGAAPPAIPGPEHKGLLMVFIAQGETILKAWKNHPDVPKLEFTLEDFEAILNGFKETFIADYESDSESEENRSMRRAFGFCERGNRSHISGLDGCRRESACKQGVI